MKRKQPKDMRPYWPVNMHGGFDPWEDGPYLREAEQKAAKKKQAKKKGGPFSDPYSWEK